MKIDLTPHEARIVRDALANHLMEVRPTVRGDAGAWYVDDVQDLIRRFKILSRG